MKGTRKTGCCSQQTFFVGIQKKLAEQGYDCDWQQCRSKIKNLRENTENERYNGETGRGRKHVNFPVNLIAFLAINQHLFYHPPGHWQ